MELKTSLHRKFWKSSCVPEQTAKLYSICILKQATVNGITEVPKGLKFHSPPSSFWEKKSSQINHFLEYFTYLTPPPPPVHSKHPSPPPPHSKTSWGCLYIHSCNQTFTIGGKQRGALLFCLLTDEAKSGESTQTLINHISQQAMKDQKNKFKDRCSGAK